MKISRSSKVMDFLFCAKSHGKKLWNSEVKVYKSSGLGNYSKNRMFDLPEKFSERWCMLGVFLLLAFTRLGHECQDLLSPCDGMHVCTD